MIFSPHQNQIDIIIKQISVKVKTKITILRFYFVLITKIINVTFSDNPTKLSVLSDIKDCQTTQNVV